MSTSVTQEEYLRRLEEAAFKRGFDAGVVHQKKADPPPKAKQYRDEAIAVRAQLANFRARVNVTVLRLAHADGEGHLPCDREAPVVEALNDLREALLESE